MHNNIFLSKSIIRLDILSHLFLATSFSSENNHWGISLKRKMCDIDTVAPRENEKTTCNGSDKEIRKRLRSLWIVCISCAVVGIEMRRNIVDPKINYIVFG